jgi:hypothetical protein
LYKLIKKGHKEYCKNDACQALFCPGCFSIKIKRLSDFSIDHYQRFIPLMLQKVTFVGNVFHKVAKKLLLIKRNPDNSEEIYLIKI